MELNAAPAGQPASELVRLVQRIERLEASATHWRQMAPAAGIDAAMVQAYISAYNADRAEIQELEKQKGVLAQSKAGEWCLGRQGQSAHPDGPEKVMLEVRLNSYTSRQGVRQQGFCGCLGGQGP